MSVKVMSHIWHDCEQVSGSHLLLLLAIADNANDEGYAWPSVTTLAQKTRLSERYVRQVAHELEDNGELIIYHRYDQEDTSNQFSNVYVIPMPGVEPHIEVRGLLKTRGGMNPSSGGGEPQFRGGVNWGSPKSSIEPSEKKDSCGSALPQSDPRRTEISTVEDSGLNLAPLSDLDLIKDSGGKAFPPKDLSQATPSPLSPGSLALKTQEKKLYGSYQDDVPKVDRNAECVLGENERISFQDDRFPEIGHDIGKILQKANSSEVLRLSANQIKRLNLEVRSKDGIFPSPIQERATNPEYWQEFIDSIPDSHYWNHHKITVAKLVDFICNYHFADGWGRYRPREIPKPSGEPYEWSATEWMR